MILENDIKKKKKRPLETMEMTHLHFVRFKGSWSRVVGKKKSRQLASYRKDSVDRRFEKKKK